MPFTAPWVIRRIKEDQTENALTQLRIWMPERRREEANEEMINRIRQLSDEHALSALKSLRKPRMFIRGSKGMQLDVTAILRTVDTLETFKVKGLVDSGCTGSCIDSKFVAVNMINTIKSAIPTKVYNVDGTLNTSGSITDHVVMRMTIGNHVERIELGVVDLGKSDLFIGHDWLKFHNPNIDWQKSTIVFDRCPSACGYNLNYMEIDEDPEDNLEPEEDLIPHLEDGDRLFGFDWKGYIAPKQLVQSSELVPNYIGEFPEVFAEAEFNQLPERRPWDHTIDLTPGAKLTDCNIYPLNAHEQKALDEFLEENLRTG